jgi:hypothetical protein
MILSKTIELSSGSAVVHELKVKQLRQLLFDFSPDGTFKNITDRDILGSRFEEIAERVKDFLQLPKGVTIDDLSISELTAIIKAFKELHKDFFDQVGRINPQSSPK